MMNMVQLDKILHVDKEKQQVRVQAGARVKEVVEALRPHGLTLQNYASIAEQQIGGFLAVGAHGTGATVPPVDEQVVRLLQHTFVQTRAEVEASHARNLEYQHMRYMWIPHTDSVVVVASNPLPLGTSEADAAAAAAKAG